MSSYSIQFQRGLPLPGFLARYGTEAQCIDAVERQRWPAGFECPRCSAREQPYRVSHGRRTVLQCRQCRHQTSLMAGTMLDSTKLPLRTWFLAMFFLSQAKTGMSALALKRHLGVSYQTAWLLHHKIMNVMAAGDARMPLEGSVVLDDAYLGGERPGKPGRGSPNKVPFVAAVQLNQEGHPIYVKLTPVPGFTTEALAQWADRTLMPGCEVLSDGLACFSGVVDAGNAHTYNVVGRRKPRDLPQFRWVNTVLANLKTTIKGAYKHFGFRKYAKTYLGAFAYRFNHRFHLGAMMTSMMFDLGLSKPLRERQIRLGCALS
jgi:Zn ribbon nucleic-acid-binding protein